jgi:cytochrome c
MKRLFGILFLSAAITSCGSNEQKAGNTTEAKSNSAAPATVNGDVTVANQKGLELIGASDCTTCHAIDRKIIGPAYIDVSKKYEATDAVIDSLVHKVKTGGMGNWGNVPMTAHPDLADNDVREMVKYILSLKNQKQ